MQPNRSENRQIYGQMMPNTRTENVPLDDELGAVMTNFEAAEPKRTQRNVIQEQVRTYIAGVPKSSLLGMVIMGVIIIIQWVCLSISGCPSTGTDTTTVPPSTVQPAQWYKEGPLIEIPNTPWTNLTFDGISKIHYLNASGVIMPCNITLSLRSKPVIEDGFRNFLQFFSWKGIKVICDVAVDSIDISDPLFEEISGNETLKDFLAFSHTNEDGNPTLKRLGNSPLYYRSTSPGRALLNLDNPALLALLIDTLSVYITDGVAGVRISHISNMSTSNAEHVLDKLKISMEKRNALLLTSWANASIEIVPQSLQTRNDDYSINPITLKKIVESTRWSAVEVPDNAEEQLNRYLWKVFSLFLPTTPIFSWQGDVLDTNIELYSEAIKIRHEIENDSSFNKADVATLIEGKYVLTRYGDGGGYMILISETFDVEYLNLTQVAPAPSKVKILHKTSGCSDLSIVGSEVSTVQFYGANLCLIILSFRS